MSGFQLPPGFTPSAGPSGGNGGGGGGGGQKGQSAEEQAAARERAAAQEEMKRSMISTMLEPAARERLSRISLTRPELGRGVEELLVRMGQQGQIRGKVTDEALKGLLEQVSGPSQAKASTPSVAPSARTKTLGGGIIIQRKGDDSDSDEYDL